MIAFPGEIIDNVIDQLRDDKDSLFNSSLACKEMLSRSRYHLFNQVDISAIPDPKSRSLRGRMSSEPQSLSSLLAILNAQWSSMGPAIEQLTVIDPFESPQIIPPDTSLIRKNLCNLKTFRWKGMNSWRDVPHSFCSFMFSLGIERFVMSDFWFWYSYEFAQLVRWWPASLSITLGMLGCGGDADDVHTPESYLQLLSGQPCLSRIHFETLNTSSSFDTSSVFRLLMASNSFSIDRLIIRLPPGDSERARWVEGLLTKYGHQINEVVQMIPPPSTITDGVQNGIELPVPNLMHCTQLRTVHIRGITLGSANSDIMHALPSMSQATQKILKSIPDPDLLEEIRITFRVDMHQKTDHQSMFMTQFQRFQWMELTLFLLSMAANSSKHEPINPKLRFHIEIGAYPRDRDSWYGMFEDNYQRYVEYIREAGMKLLEEAGFSLIFKLVLVEYPDQYEVIDLAR